MDFYPAAQARAETSYSDADYRLAVRIEYEHLIVDRTHFAYLDKEQVAKLIAQTRQEARQKALEEAAELLVREAAGMAKKASSRYTLYRIIDRIRATFNTAPNAANVSVKKTPSPDPS